jgi:aminodeoxychorismate lyase
MAVLVFLNGAFVPEEKAVVSVFDRGFLYGDGLFETIRVVNGNLFRWPEHFTRLHAGAKFLKIKVPFSAWQLQRIADELIARNEMPDSLLRVNLSRGTGLPGYSPKGAGKATLAMSLRAAPKPDPKNPPVWKLVTSSFRIATKDPLACFKTSNKLPQILAREEAPAAGEALLLNTDGYVAEGTSGNVFWVRRGMVYTPPLTAGILPGITRAIVFEIAASLGIPIREKNTRPADLALEDAIFLSLTSWGIVEVGEFDGTVLKRSDVVGRIRAAYEECVLRGA